MSEPLQRLLLIDTCGETAGVAVCAGEQVLASEDLATRETSANMLPAVRRILQVAGCTVADLDAVGVVGGPGSFTGLRTGLAAAKGLCEARGLPAAVVSRLEVLADAAGTTEGVAVLDAGRGELYVRDTGTAREWLCTDEELTRQLDGELVVVAEVRVAERLGRYSPILRPLHVSDAFACVLNCLAGGGSDVARAESNYLRTEQSIYSHHASPPRGQTSGQPHGQPRRGSASGAE